VVASASGEAEAAGGPQRDEESHPAGWLSSSLCGDRIIHLLVELRYRGALCAAGSKPITVSNRSQYAGLDPIRVIHLWCDPAQAPLNSSKRPLRQRSRPGEC
jgi:hypothetical protein